MGREWPLVSLFSGGGGLDYGLALAGFDTRLAVEIEPYAYRTLLACKELARTLPNGHIYLSAATIHQGDVAKLSGPKARKLAGLARGEAALLVGGPPCVTFSIAGRREGLTSETGMLYRHFVRMLRAFQPEAFIFENVRGLVSAVGIDGRRSAFEMILNDLDAAGYSVTWRVVDAADYGVPQHRHRVIILGRRGRTALAFPEPTHSDRKTENEIHRKPWTTLRQALAGLPDAVPVGTEPRLRNHTAKRHSLLTQDSFRATPPGKRNETHKRDRLLWEFPAKTIRAQGKVKADGSGQKNSSHQAIHPDEPRQLTPRECARIQTFPDWYPFPENLVNAYRVIGDAVPSGLALALGDSIAVQLGLRSEVAAVG